MASVPLQALSVPDSWHARPCWRVLEVGSSAGLSFLTLWQAWRDDPQRPRVLHHVAIEPDSLAWHARFGLAQRAGRANAALLARQLSERCWGLTPGFHRFSFDDGQVLLTLCIGPVDAMLRAQQFEADSIWLGEGAAQAWIAADAHAGKTLARRCRRGSRLAAWQSSLPPTWRDVLRASGFVPTPAPDAGYVCATFDPAWTPRKRHDAEQPALPAAATSALVIGAGIAGAAVAASLARRGLQVQVLDAKAAPAQGTSSLPAGLMAPHASADDNLRSRLARAGLRATIEFAQQRLVPGRDWQSSGVLERRPDALRMLAERTDAASRDWSEPASASHKRAANLDDLTPAIWHRRAGWIRPDALVRALLNDPRIAFQGDAAVQGLRPFAGGWQAVRPDGSVVTQAPLVVLAAGHASAGLAGMNSTLPLQPVRGQLSFGRHSAATGIAHAEPGQPIGWPPFPVNGHGSLLPDIPLGDTARGWIFGATYGRDDIGTDVRVPEHRLNLERLRELSPEVADAMAARWNEDRWQGWAGVRAVAPDRLPMVGPLPVSAIAAGRQQADQPSRLWVCTALGSRGLSQAICCAELLAAQLFEEPLAVEPALAKALDVRRFCR